MGTQNADEYRRCASYAAGVRNIENVSYVFFFYFFFMNGEEGMVKTYACVRASCLYIIHLYWNGWRLSFDEHVCGQVTGRTNGSRLQIRTQTVLPVRTCVCVLEYFISRRVLLLHAVVYDINTQAANL